MSGCGGNCACAKRACDETRAKLGLPAEEGQKVCPCGKPLAECCKVTGKTCGVGTCEKC